MGEGTKKTFDKTASRRQFLAVSGAVAAVGLAGCSGGGEGDESGGSENEDPEAETADEPAFDPVTVDIPPTATYLRTNNDAAGDTTPIALSDQPFGPGDRITLERLGEFDNGSPSGSAGLGMHAVLSGSDTLLPQSEFHRVPDAIDVGGYHETTPTYYGGRWTSISEDFLVANNDGSRTSVTIDIPEGATHLFVAAKDNLYEDNSVLAEEFAVRISDGAGTSLTAATDEEPPEELPPTAGDGDDGGDDDGLAVSPDTTISLDPTATYLRTNNDDANDATPIALSEFDLSPGDDVTVSVDGTYGNGQGDRRKRTVAVFSGSDELAPSDNRNRVADAIDAGLDVETPTGYRGDIATDIPEDFAVAADDSFNGVTLTIPEGATHLFVSPVDDFFEDNTGGEYALGITTY